VELVAADIGIVVGRAQLDAGNIRVHRRGDLVLDLVLGHGGSYGAD
jgi:hypothetical protein